MRFLYATLLAVYLTINSAVTSDASALNLDPNTARIFTPTIRHSDPNLDRRMLKTNDADKAGSNYDVERAYIPGLSPIVGALSKISPSAQELANKVWLKSRTNPALVFNMLRFGEAATKLDDNPRFLLWLNYVDMYRKLELRSFSDEKIIHLLLKFQSEARLVSLSLSLREIPARKNLADLMQFYLVEGSASSRKLLNEAWLKSRETPQSVFKILRLDRARLPVDKLPDNSKFLLWFKYCEMHWPAGERDLRTFKFLQSYYDDSEMHIALLFQAVQQRPELGDLGDNLQSFLFKKWVDKKFTPGFVRSKLALPWGTAIFKLDKDNVFYRALEEYTVYYTAIWGDQKVLKTVRGLFANDEPYEALAVAMSLAKRQ
ncbi:hypothetical protein PHYSODRAFT_285572 [Phytophthora sojae]|uniref:Uncharacterized protein n=2 Tax=Phytophthora sojae TaxID=67593 RepID=G4ZAZ4_PHYSP|nr:hypothetical protein PHYSODRAFT_285572 [Phytophthora sojae]AEK81220.1 Avh347 [Phytophthora sojae]EGZ21213.1 hypothetical protein PHYSODRAFT_285572 [Phytophthora sojae]|eukprot:XP_009523930.1 hypothetical protein PHYSODRAFT_285572 [Phytophthora sojae]